MKDDDATKMLARSLVDAPEDELIFIEEAEPDPGPPMLKTSIRVPCKLHDWAKAEAERRGMDGWSALVRQLLEAEQRRERKQVTVDIDALVRFLQADEAA